MRNVFFLSPIVALSVSCSTLDQSFRLGAATGALTGAAATYAAGSTSGHQPSLEEVGIGASIGLGLGLITSYFMRMFPEAEILREHTIGSHDMARNLPSPLNFVERFQS